MQRAGIGFTDQQKDQIKTMVKHNNVLKAQKIILDEVDQAGRRPGGGGREDVRGPDGDRPQHRPEPVRDAGREADADDPEAARPADAKWLNNSKNQKKVLDTVNARRRGAGGGRQGVIDRRSAG